MIHTQTNDMSNQDPLVSVCMLAYNIESFIGEAIEGVMQQQTNFPVELVIGEDCSRDATRKVCETYLEKYPGRIRLLPADNNLGIAGNAAKTLAQCRGKYIAVCDGDDVWTDVHKLQDQVHFLEQNPDYGAVYTDVQTIDEHGNKTEDPDHAYIRELYAAGDLFYKLLTGNFINNSTAVFRKQLIEGYDIDTDRDYYTHDHLLWLYISAQAKIHFINAKTTRYRKHSGGVTNSIAKLTSNKKKFQYHLYDILISFDKFHARPKSAEERMLIFQKIMSILYRKENTLKMKTHILGLIPRYFPGIIGLSKLFFGKLVRPRFTLAHQ
jgi:glycosyltransferase involved in cell wall biosynthesis